MVHRCESLWILWSLHFRDCCRWTKSGGHPLVWKILRDTHVFWPSPTDYIAIYFLSIHSRTQVRFGFSNNDIGVQGLKICEASHPDGQHSGYHASYIVSPLEISKLRKFSSFPMVCLKGKVNVAMNQRTNFWDSKSALYQPSTRNKTAHLWRLDDPISVWARFTGADWVLMKMWKRCVSKVENQKWDIDNFLNCRGSAFTFETKFHLKDPFWSCPWSSVHAFD